MNTYLKSVNFYTETNSDIIDQNYWLPYTLACVFTKSTFRLIKHHRDYFAEKKAVKFFDKLVKYMCIVFYGFMFVFFVLRIMSVCNSLFCFVSTIIVLFIFQRLRHVYCMLILLIMSEIGVRFCISKIGDITQMDDGKLKITLYEQLWLYNVISSGDFTLIVKENQILSVLKRGLTEYVEIDKTQYFVQYYQPIFMQ